MNETWFKEFGNLLDTLYHVMRNSDDDVESLIQVPYEELDAIYYDVKEKFGYKDSSDEE